MVGRESSSDGERMLLDVEADFDGCFESWRSETRPNLDSKKVEKRLMEAERRLVVF